MPNAIKRHKLPMLQPRLKELQPRIKLLGSRTLKDKQQSNGRTLALDGAAWRKLRAVVLSSEPLCRHCTARGLTVPATEVDHRNGPADNRLESLQPLCKPCHSVQTNADMGRKSRNPLRGCDAEGRPLDPCHPWGAAQTGEKSPATGTPRTGSTLYARGRSWGE